MSRLLVGTTDGLHELDLAGAVTTVHHQGHTVVAVVRGAAGLWAILDGSELWSSAGGDGWVLFGGLNGLRGHCVADTGAGVVVGTSEARLLRATDDGLEPLTSFERAPGRNDWYTPWGDPPDTRSISEHADTVYVNVHVGGILRSRDLGDSWEPTIDVHADVHRVWTGRSRVFAACARGLAVSTDQGHSWTVHTDGLHATYCRSGAICGDAVLTSASTGPSGRHAAVYRGGLDGRNLERCRRGLPEWFDHNIDSHCLDARPDGSFAAFATSYGCVFASDDQGATWSELASSFPGVRCLVVIS